MRIRLGYVAISNTLGITTSKTITYSQYQKLSDDDKKAKINEIVTDNLLNLEKILIFNIRNYIIFYRMTSKLVPLITHPACNIDISDEHKTKLREIGDLIKKYHLRVDTHPDQFCVLNSTKKEVIESSIKILNYHQQLFKIMNIEGKIILHVGSSVFGKKASLTRFENTFNKLNSKLQKMIILENDDKVFNMIDVLGLCKRLEIPMVLDILHHNCNNNGEKIEDYIIEIFDTWKNEKQIPKIHFSSSKSLREKRSHNDYINVDDLKNFIEKIKFLNKDFDIMIEAKAKDEALFRLIRLLKYKNLYKISKNEIIIN